MKRILSLTLICLTAFALVLGSAGLMPAKGDEPVHGYGLSGSKTLSIGKSYTVSYDSPIENAYPKKAYKQESKLTDGQYASSTSYNESAFTQFYRGTFLYLTFDLESVCAVESVSVHGLRNNPAGIYEPRNISVAVSEDGESFGTVALYKDSAPAGGAKSAAAFEVPIYLPKPYKARYVRLTINSDVFLYLDEVTVTGSEDASAGASASADEPAEDAGYCGPIDGIRNICLMYTVGQYRSEHLLPYLAYVDTEGRPKDTLYDGMLFLPSGASGFDFSSPSGWDAYIDDLFGEKSNTNLTALNDAVGLYGFELGFGEDYRYPVFLAVPKLKEGSDEFDGLYPLNLDNKLTIIKGYIDGMIRRFNDAGLDRLELKGFYWHEELIPYTEYNYAEDLVKGFTSYVHDRGYKALWIPYYCASGFERATELGFDGACLQAGYAFDHSQSENGDSLAAACEDSARQARKYGLGIEFELDLNVSNFYKRFFKYVHTAYATGCRDSGLMAMYQGVYDIYTCSRAEANSDKRNVYELLYQYISGTFTSIPPVLEDGQVILAETGTKVSGNLTVVDPDSAKNALKIKERNVQEGLTAVFEGDGFYLINTKDTVPGSYSVRLTLTDGYNLSDPAEIRVVVYDKAAERPSKKLEKDLPVYTDLVKRETVQTVKSGETVTYLSVSDDAYYVFLNGEPAGISFADDLGLPKTAPVDDASETEPSSGPKSLWPLWVGIGVAAAAAAAAAVLLILKKKKKK